MRRLWRFNGGLRLAGKRQPASGAPLAIAQIPHTLIYPLQQRPGVIAEPVVSIGDRVLKGQKIADSDQPVSVPLHAASSGFVKVVEHRPYPHPSHLSGRCIIIETDGKDDALPTFGIPDYLNLAFDGIRDRIREAGIVGLGGSAFPTSVKLHRQEHHALDILILNGAECEPYISCDDCLLKARPYEVLEGARILLHVLQIDRCIIGLEDDIPETVQMLRDAAKNPGYEGIEVVSVPTRYPSGGEKQLIRVLTGREVPSEGIPADAGVLCQNVATAVAIYHAVIFGEPLISRIITIAGKGIQRPQNLVVRIGTPISQLIDQCGGYSGQVERLIMGGPMMGIALPTDEIPVTKATNCILAASRDEIITETQPLPCIRCGECARACPANLLPQQLYWHCRSGALKKAEDFALRDCIECGCCEVVCPSYIPLVQYYRSTKSDIAAKQREKVEADHARSRYLVRQARLARERTERAVRAQRKRAVLKKTSLDEIKKSVARVKAKKNVEAGVEGNNLSNATPRNR